MADNEEKSFSSEELSERSDAFIERYMAGLINMAAIWPFTLPEPELGGLVVKCTWDGAMSNALYLPAEEIREALKDEYHEQFDGWFEGLQIAQPELGFVLMLIFPNGQNVAQLVRPTGEDMDTARQIYSNLSPTYTGFGPAPHDSPTIQQ